MLSYTTIRVNHQKFTMRKESTRRRTEAYTSNPTNGALISWKECSRFAKIGISNRSYDGLVHGTKIRENHRYNNRDACCRVINATDRTK